MSDHEARCFPMELYGAIPYDRVDFRDIRVALLNGQKVSFSSMVEQPTILNFFTTW